MQEYSIEVMNVECGSLSAKQADPNLFILPNGAYLHVDYHVGLTEEERRKPGIQVKAA